MYVSKTRYVTVCQQFLATAAVGVLGLTAAGIATLDIVRPDATPQRTGLIVSPDAINCAAGARTQPLDAAAAAAGVLRTAPRSARGPRPRACIASGLGKRR